MQGYDPYQIKKEELSGDISKFPPVQLRTQLIIVNFFLFFIESTDKGRFGSVQKFRVLQSVCIRMGQGTKNKTVF